MAHRIKELFKDVLILLLVAAIIVLSLLALPSRTLTETPWLAAALKPVASFFGISRSELTALQPEQSDTAAALPLAVSVRNETGRCSFQYDFAALDAAYESLGGLLAQALDTAQAPQPSGRTALYSALSAESAAFRYPCMIDCGVLAAWLGVQTEAAGVRADFCILDAAGNTVRLYLCGDDVFVCDTRLSAQSFRGVLAAYRPDGSFFAFESQDDAFRRIDGCSLLSAETPALPKVSAQNPFDSRLTTALAAELGFNPYGDSTYFDDHGNAFFSETNVSLQIRSDGQLLLENSDNTRFDARSDAPADRIEAARVLLSQILSHLSTDARIYLTDASDDGVYCFDYTLSGTPVLQPEGSAVTVSFSGKHIRSLKILLRGYLLQNEPIPLLPAQQAAIIADTEGLLCVCYAESFAQQLTAGWICR